MQHGLDDMDVVREIVLALAEAGYRELSPRCNQQRMAVARRLYREGANERLVRLLWTYAQACDKHGTPQRLFAYWMDMPSRAIAKMQEIREHEAWARFTLTNTQKDVAEKPEQAAKIIELAKWRKGGR